MEFWCKCTGRKPWAENLFTTGSNAFTTGRKQLRMNHVRVGHRQTEHQTWSSECKKCWHKIGEWLYDWWRRNWALARTWCTPLSTKIWVSGRSVPGLCRISWQTNRKQNGWKLLEISLPYVTRIHPFCEPSSQGMRPGATSLIRNPSDNRWNGVHCLPRNPKTVACKSPRSRQCWSPSSIAMASSIRNSFLRVKPWIPHSTRKFWNGCYDASTVLARVAQDWTVDVAAR